MRVCSANITDLDNLGVGEQEDLILALLARLEQELLQVILVGSRPDSATYVRNKKKAVRMP